MPAAVLLVVLDALRRDVIAPYGAAPGAMPTVRDLAGRGCAVPHAYATSSWTLPSHASMFTGLLPRQLGLGQPPGGSPHGARARIGAVADRLLPQVLRRAGYRTHGFSTNLWVSEHDGLDLGFDTFTYTTPDRGTAMLGNGPASRARWALEALRATGDNGAADMRRLLRGAIEDWDGTPTFWFLNLCECHAPYLPPRPFNDLSPSERVAAAFDTKRYFSFESICLHVAGRREVPAAALARMRHLYECAARYMDTCLADVLEALDRRGILEETLVIVTADHGENFGEDGLIAHGFSLDERLIHIPLVMAGPGGEALEHPFSLADLPALIGLAAGLADHPWLQREMPTGIAIAQYDPMGPASHPRVREFAERWHLDDGAVRRLTARLTCATDGRYKLLERDEEELYFDLASDPEEVWPLDPSAAGVELEHLRAALASHALTGPPPYLPVADGSESSLEEQAQLDRQMKLLGYL